MPSEIYLNNIIHIMQNICNANPTQQTSEPIFQFEDTYSEPHNEGNPSTQPSITPMHSKDDLQRLYPQLKYTKDGDINFNAYSFENLKKMYPSNKYKIEILNSNKNNYYVIVTDKKNGKIIFSYSKLKNYDKDLYEVVSFCEGDKDISLSYENGKFYTRGIFSKDTSFTELYDKNFNLCRTKTFPDNQSMIEKYYANGKVYREIKSKKINETDYDIEEDKKILVDNLTKYFSSVSKIGFFYNTLAIKSILEGINYQNILEIWLDYYNKNGSDLLQDIVDNKCNTNYKTQKKLLEHLYNNAIEILDGFIIGYQIQLALKNKDSDYLKQVLSQLTEDNIFDALQNIYKIDKNNYEDFDDFSQNLYKNLKILLKDDPILLQKFTCLMINSINKRGGYCKDIEADLKAHKGDVYKTSVDFTRLANRCQSAQDSKVTGKADGKIDINDIKQGNTGDCWLLGALISATNKNKQFLDYVNSLLSVDAQGNVTVFFKGINKKYKITAEEIEKSNHLSNGDPDIRAIEIAVDKYLKETAYAKKSDLSDADLNGDWESKLYKLIFGNGQEIHNADIRNRNFNSKNTVYALVFYNKNDTDTKVQASIVNGENRGKKVNIVLCHAYAVKGSDKKYIYIINPWNSSETLSIKRTDLQNYSICLSSATLPNS